MTAEQVLKLVEAGYTKADIEALSKPAEVTPEEKSAEEPEVKPEEKPAENELLQELKALKEALRLKNIHTDEKESPVTESAEDILIKLLNGKENNK